MMDTHPRLFAALLVFALTLLGCSRESDGDTDTLDPQQDASADVHVPCDAPESRPDASAPRDAEAISLDSLDALNQSLAQVYCEQVFSCCGTASELETALSEFLFVSSTSSQQDCEQALYEAFTAQATGLPEQIATGAVSFDPAHASACTTATRRLSCQDFLWRSVPENASCETRFVGQLQEGEPCMTPFGCQVGTYCEPSDQTCHAIPGEGEACLSRCAVGTSCSESSGVCVRHLEAGESCGPSQPARCGSELYCELESGVCTLRKSLGCSCTSALECGSFRCVEDNSGASVCAPPPCL